MPVHEESKERALEQMEWIYKSATKVLVIDQRLLEISTSKISPEEIGLRIMCSV